MKILPVVLCLQFILHGEKNITNNLDWVNLCKCLTWFSKYFPCHCTLFVDHLFVCRSEKMWASRALNLTLKTSKSMSKKGEHFEDNYKCSCQMNVVATIIFPCESQWRGD